MTGITWWIIAVIVWGGVHMAWTPPSTWVVMIFKAIYWALVTAIVMVLGVYAGLVKIELSVCTKTHFHKQTNISACAHILSFRLKHCYTYLNTHTHLNLSFSPNVPTEHLVSACKWGRVEMKSTKANSLLWTLLLAFPQKDQQERSRCRPDSAI